MLKIQTILHPTDFSEHSAYAFELANILAKAAGAKIAVLHVKEPPGISYAQFAAIPSPSESQEELLKKLTAVKLDDSEPTVEHHLTQGIPADEILRVSEKLDAEMIVMGSHGHSALGRLLLGSVAETVARKAKCPVVTVRNPSEMRSADDKERNHIAPQKSRKSIRNLAVCPYCSDCEIALDENLDLVFCPNDGPNAPCPHVVWVTGRFTEWSQMRGVDRVIGSKELGWLYPSLQSLQDDEDLIAYVQDLVTSGSNWEFAPKQPFEICPMADDEKITDADGKEHLAWEVDGVVIFASDADEMAEALPIGRDRALSAFDRE